MFVDVHSHVVPSGDDGVRSVEEGLALCEEAAARGTRTLVATPHIWRELTLTPERERSVRAAYEEMAPRAAEWGLDLQLGFELSPSPALLDDDVRRYRLGDYAAVLLELPFHGPLALAERLAEHVEASGLLPVIAHPERSEVVIDDPGIATALRERGWLLQINATSLLGYHGPAQEATAWKLVDEDDIADLVASDGHRAARPPFLDEAYRLVRARVGERADVLFSGAGLPAGDRVDLAQRR
jgi:protein-tyrosine phosphatase